MRYDGAFYFPIFQLSRDRPSAATSPTQADYNDPEVAKLIDAKGWMLWPLIPYSYDTIVKDLGQPAPCAAHRWRICSAPTTRRATCWRRLIYGFRISVLFGFLLTILGSISASPPAPCRAISAAGSTSLFQRFLEIWSSMPTLYLLIILASFIQPGFWSLLGIMLLFGWMALVGLVRAEFLRGRNFDYVRAARALGMLDVRIMFRHILPNAMTASLTFLPFILAGSVTTLTALDFLGFGLPPGSPSLGELLLQGKNNLNAPWLAFTGFVVLALMMSLLVFIGEAVRDAFDPRKVLA